MGRKWDASGIAFNVDAWKNCLTVLKPGGILLAFGSPRTYHRVACAIEDAGFFIKDSLMWLYGSAMPKGLNISKEIDKRIEKGENINNTWEGWNSQLKPMYEPIIVAQKPFEGGITDNLIKNGIGAYNINACRIPFVNKNDEKETKTKNRHGLFQSKPPINNSVLGDFSMIKPKDYEAEGRFPGNVILTDVDDSLFPNSKSADNKEIAEKGGYCFSEGQRSNKPCSHGYSDEGSNSRFFPKVENNDEEDCRFYYGAKATPKDREEGCDNITPMPQTSTGKGNGLDRVCEFCGETQLSGKCKCEKKSWINKLKKNNHPSVKPTDLMIWLLKLVAPKNATIMDCFLGSGSTGKAVAVANKIYDANYKFIGIELDEHYCDIAKARIEFAENNKTYIESKKKV